MNKYRNIIGCLLVLIIVLMGSYMYLNSDNLFKRTVKITYPDGCIETYDNEILVSPECYHGRLLYERTLNNTMPPIVYDGSINNLTFKNG